MFRLFRRLFPLCFVSLAACSSSSAAPATPPAGVLVLALSSDLQIPGDLDVLEAQVDVGGSTPFLQTYNLPTEAPLPGTLVLVTTGDTAGAPKGTINPGQVPIGAAGACTVTLRARHGATEVVTRIATLELAGAFSKKLALSLDKACLSVACGTGTTCIAGVCSAPDVSLAALPSP